MWGSFFTLQGSYGVINIGQNYARILSNIYITGTCTSLYISAGTSTNIVAPNAPLMTQGVYPNQISNSYFRTIAFTSGGAKATTHISNCYFENASTLTGGHFIFNNCTFKEGLTLNFPDAINSAIFTGCHFLNVNSLGTSSTLTISATTRNINVIGCFVDSAIVDNSGLANIVAPVVL